MTAAAGEIACYVSPSGSDTNDGSAGKPFQTLARAQNALRNLPAKATNDIVIWLRGGDYRLASTLTFSPADSGGNGHLVIYRAAKGEKPILNGGKTVTGWTVHDPAKNIWQAQVTGADNFRQLYVNGTKATRARSKGNMGLKPGPSGYTTGDISLQGYGNPTDMEVVSQRRPWTQGRSPITAIAGGEISIGGHTPHPALWIENAYEFMDKPGNWYLNRKSHTVFYIPRPGEDMKTAVIEAPVLEQLIRVDGKADAPVSNLRFEGLALRMSNWLQPGTGGGLPDNQANQMEPPVKAAIELAGARNVVVGHCSFSDLGGNGIDLNEACQKDAVFRCDFHDIAASAVQCGSGSDKAAALPLGSGDIVSGIVISNCTIHNIGTDYPAACALFLGHVQSCTVEHNEIHAVPYTGISLGWGHSEKKVESSTGNRILSNKIYDHMRSLSDGGGIYCLAYQSGGLISGNYIYGQHHAFADIYLDDGSTNWMVKSNVCKTAGGAALWLLHKGSNHRVEDIPTVTLLRTGCSPVASGSRLPRTNGTNARSF